MGDGKCDTSGCHGKLRQSCLAVAEPDKLHRPFMPGPKRTWRMSQVRTITLTGISNVFFLIVKELLHCYIVL